MEYLQQKMPIIKKKKKKKLSNLNTPSTSNTSTKMPKIKNKEKKLSNSNTPSSSNPSTNSNTPLTSNTSTKMPKIKNKKKVKLSDLLSTPKNWSNQKSEVKQVILSTKRNEYRIIKEKLSGESLEYLKKIARVQNPYLYHRYMLRKLEYKALGISYTERLLVHATAESNVPSILKNNLDWRLVKRAKFGQGVSFSSCAKYANKECSKDIGIKRVMIVVKVLVGKQHLGSYKNELPQKGFDTTNGRGSKVIVKYYDDEFYPAYVAYYDNLPRMDLLQLFNQSYS